MLMWARLVLCNMYDSVSNLNEVLFCSYQRYTDELLRKAENIEKN